MMLFLIPFNNLACNILLKTNKQKNKAKEIKKKLLINNLQNYRCINLYHILLNILFIK